LSGRGRPYQAHPAQASGPGTEMLDSKLSSQMPRNSQEVYQMR
jgi:hypothetical protein